MIWGWAPGVLPLEMPSEAGFRIGAGGIMSIEINIHYDNPSGLSGHLDSSGVRMYYTENLRTYDAGVAQFGDGIMSLAYLPTGINPIGKHKFVCDTSCTSGALGASGLTHVTAFSRQHHMHLSGVRQTTRQYSASGELIRSTLTDWCARVRVRARAARRR